MIDEAAGALFCNQCFSHDNGDGIAAVQWATGCEFPIACQKIADYLKLDFSTRNTIRSQPPRVVCSFEYRDETGRLLYCIDRREPGAKGKAKDFVARGPNGERSTKGVRHVLYRLDELVKANSAEFVFIPEGEKHCDALEALGLTATTNPFGAGGWKTEYSESLRGRHVVILPDNDDPGRAHAKQVAESLIGIAASIRRLALPGLPPKGDVINWLAAGGSREDLLKLASEAIDEAKSDDRPRSIAELLTEHKGLRPAVIDKIAREGETMNLIAQSKVGKSWLVYDVALSIATGTKWLGTFQAERGRVLLIDNELHPETLVDRIPKVAEALGIQPEQYAHNFDVLTLRGRLKDINILSAEFADYKPGQYKCIILDALYRTLPRGAKENANEDFTPIYNLIDQQAMRLGAAFILIHHASKGQQDEKSVTDVGSGAGAIARAVDSHVVLRRHQEPGVIVLDAALRSWPAINPICLRWEFPIWTPDYSLDPADLWTPKRRRRAASQPATSQQPEAKWTAKRFAERFVSDSPAQRAAIIDDAIEAGLSNKLAEQLFDRALAKGLARPWKDAKDKRRILYANIAQPEFSETLAP